MKIAFLSSIYPSHCNLIYKKNPRLAKMSYVEQKSFIDRVAICSMSKWPKLLNDIGHESIMLIRNNPYMQQMWCRENEFHDDSGI